MAMLEVAHLKKVYTTRFGGNQVEALRDVSFTVEQGEYTAIMGESGSGKSTRLRCATGLEKQDAGEILYDGTFGLVFQNFNLFPHFSVFPPGLPPAAGSRTAWRATHCGTGWNPWCL